MYGGNTTTLEVSNSIVYNNYIHDFGQVNRTYNGAVHVGGCGVTVSHNEIANAPHLAIPWGGPLHIFEYNEIYNVCMETSDSAAFYHYLQWDVYGCVIRYNYIHDIGQGNTYANAIYWDGGLPGQTAYGNIIVNATGFAFEINGGRDNVIENNIIINARKGIHYSNFLRQCALGTYFNVGARVHIFTLSDRMMALKQNEYWVEKFPILGQMKPFTEDFSGDIDDPLLMCNPAGCVIKNNITYIYSTDFNDVDLSKLSHKYDDNAVVEFSEVENNPIIRSDITDFPGWHNGDYTMIENSKAKELCPDFKPIPFDRIGRIK